MMIDHISLFTSGLFFVTSTFIPQEIFSWPLKPPGKQLKRFFWNSYFPKTKMTRTFNISTSFCRQSWYLTLTWYGGGGPKLEESFPSVGLSLPLKSEISSAVGVFRQLPIVNSDGNNQFQHEASSILRKILPYASPTLMTGKIKTLKIQCACP